MVLLLLNVTLRRALFFLLKINHFSINLFWQWPLYIYTVVYIFWTISVNMYSTAFVIFRKIGPLFNTLPDTYTGRFWIYFSLMCWHQDHTVLNLNINQYSNHKTLHTEFCILYNDAYYWAIYILARAQYSLQCIIVQNTGSTDIISTVVHYIIFIIILFSKKFSMGLWISNRCLCLFKISLCGFMNKKQKLVSFQNFALWFDE